MPGEVFEYKFTGEDWDDTKIVLSTGKPALGGTAPTPEPWYIYLYKYETEIMTRRRVPVESAKEVVSGINQVITYQKGAPAVETGISVWYPLRDPPAF